MLALSFANDDSSFSVLGSNVAHVADFGSTTSMAFARYYAGSNSNIGYIMGVSNVTGVSPVFTIGELSSTEFGPASAVSISLHNGNVGIGGVMEPTSTLDVAGNSTFSGQMHMTTTDSSPFIIDSSLLITNLNADMLDGQEGSFYRNANNINAGTLGVSRGGTGLTSVAAGRLPFGGGGTAALSTSSNLTWNDTISTLSVQGISALGPSDATSGPFMRQKTWDAAAASHTIAFADYALGENSAGLLNIQVSNKSTKLAVAQCAFLKVSGNNVEVTQVSLNKTVSLTTCTFAASLSNIQVTTDADCSIAWTSIGAL